MLIDKIVSGKIAKPVRLMVYGPPGVGKSTFAAGSDKPIFLDIEKRTDHLNVDRVVINTWADFLQANKELLEAKKSGKCSYNTIVTDTADHLEHMIHQWLCESTGAPNILEYGGGWGKGISATVTEWKRFGRAMTALRDAGFMQVLLAHSQVKMFKNPTGEDYDRYQLKMMEQSSGYLRESVDAVGFATFEDMGLKKEKTDPKAKGVTTGERVLYFKHSAAFESKKGIELPDVIPLDWGKLAEHIQ